MRFVNAVVDSNDEDDDIFKPGRSFSDIFNAFVNQWCVKKDKNMFKLEFGFHAFSKIFELLDTHTHSEIKMLRIKVFWSKLRNRNAAKCSF